MVQQQQLVLKKLLHWFNKQPRRLRRARQLLRLHGRLSRFVRVRASPLLLLRVGCRDCRPWLQSLCPGRRILRRLLFDRSVTGTAVSGNPACLAGKTAGLRLVPFCIGRALVISWRQRRRRCRRRRRRRFQSSRRPRVHRRSPANNCSAERSQQPTKRPASATSWPPGEQAPTRDTLNNSNVTMRRFTAQLLVAHNEYRALHQAPPLRYSEDLSRQAQIWADMLASKDALAYDLTCDHDGIGENVARKCDVRSSDATAQEFVDTWYSEASNFDWRSLDDQFGCSHFAQLVWRSTREAGFGRAVSVSGCIYVVGRYRPKGINPGEFPRNVLPIIKHKTSTQQSTSAGSMRLSRNSDKARLQEAATPPRPSAQQGGTHLGTVHANHVTSSTDPKAFTTSLLAKMLPAKKNQIEEAVPPPQPPAPAALAAAKAGEMPQRLRSNQQAEKQQATVNAAGKAGTTGATGATGAASPTPGKSGLSPMSAKSLFSALGSFGGGGGGGGFGGGGGGSSPGGSSGGIHGGLMTASILRQTLGDSHKRDARMTQLADEPVPAFSMRKFTNQMLVSHNEYRSQHRVPPLRLNPELSKLAQDWADVLAMRDRMAHDPNCSIVSTGENVAMKFRIGETNFPGDVFTDLWYDESESYDWTSEGPQMDCGHFTQMIWKSTSEVGFGRAVSDTGRVYVVGRYRPPGNYKGQFKENVLPNENDVTKPAGEESSIIKREPMLMPSPMSFSVRDFGLKRRSVQFTGKDADGGGKTGLDIRSQPGGVTTRSLGAFLPLKSALRGGGGSGGGAAGPTATGEAAGGGGSGGAGGLSALLLRRTLEQGHMRTVEKKVEKDQENFSMRKFENQLLVSHNEFRALHRAPPLRLNPELSKLAQAWADVLASKDKMAHDPKCSAQGLGENVAMKFRRGFTTFPGDLFSELWYHEIDQYKWTGEDQLECGHFTQLVWRSSTEAGFGRAVAKSGRVYVVGRYRPPGNYSGQFGRNVLPPSRVMPKSRNNVSASSANFSANRDRKQCQHHQSQQQNQPSRAAAPPTPDAEYAGFGAARVVPASGRSPKPALSLQAVPLTTRTEETAAKDAKVVSAASSPQQQQQQQGKSTG